MVDRLKIALWSFLMSIGSLLPMRLMTLIARVMISAVAESKPDVALKSLLTVDEELHQRIDSCAIRYEGGLHPKHRLTNYHQFFIKRIRAGENVLDIGCGYGAVAFSIAQAGAKVTGIDLNEEYIRIALDRYRDPLLNFIVGDATEHLPDGHFDVVVLSNVLEHIERRTDFLTKIQGKVHPSRYLIRVPMLTREWLIPMKMELGLPYFSDPTHFTEYTLDSFKAEMEKAHLSLKHYEISWGEIWAEVGGA